MYQKKWRRKNVKGETKVNETMANVKDLLDVWNAQVSLTTSNTSKYLSLSGSFSSKFVNRARPVTAPFQCSMQESNVFTNTYAKKLSFLSMPWMILQHYMLVNTILKHCLNLTGQYKSNSFLIKSFKNVDSGDVIDNT